MVCTTKRRASMIWCRWCNNEAAVQQLLTRTAIVFPAIVLSLVDSIVLHPFDGVAVHHWDVLVGDVNYLVDMQHNAIQQRAHGCLDVLTCRCTRLQVRQTEHTSPTTISINCSYQAPNVFTKTVSVCIINDPGPSMQTCWWLNFLCCQSSCVECFAIIYMTEHVLQTLQKITERV